MEGSFSLTGDIFEGFKADIENPRMVEMPMAESTTSWESGVLPLTHVKMESAIKDASGLVALSQEDGEGDSAKLISNGI